MTTNRDVDIFRKNLSTCSGPFCSQVPNNSGLPANGSVASFSGGGVLQQWFCLTEGSLELLEGDAMLSAEMVAPSWNGCNKEYSICKDNTCAKTRVYFPCLPAWAPLSLLTPLHFPGYCESGMMNTEEATECECEGDWTGDLPEGQGCCEDPTGVRELTDQQTCESLNGTWTEGEPCEELSACLEGPDFMQQMCCSCVLAFFNTSTGNWESDFTPDFFYGLVKGTRTEEQYTKRQAIDVTIIDGRSVTAEEIKACWACDLKTTDSMGVQPAPGDDGIVMPQDRQYVRLKRDAECPCCFVAEPACQYKVVQYLRPGEAQEAIIGLENDFLNDGDPVVENTAFYTPDQDSINGGDEMHVVWDECECRWIVTVLICPPEAEPVQQLALLNAIADLQAKVDALADEAP